MKSKEVLILLVNGQPLFGSPTANVYFRCPHCGEIIENKECCNFCSNCGGKLKKCTVNPIIQIKNTLTKPITTVESKLKEELIASGLWEQ